MPKLFSDPEAIVDEIIRDVGKRLVVGLPLGLGKANHIVNALYARAAADPSITLTLFSALTLEPRPSGLLNRVWYPVVERLFGGYPGLPMHARFARAGCRPTSRCWNSSSWPAGGARTVRQQHYISANYPCRLLPVEHGLSVVLQLVIARG